MIAFSIQLANAWPGTQHAIHQLHILSAVACWSTDLVLTVSAQPVFMLLVLPGFESS